MSASRTTKKINSEPEFVCDMIMGQAANTKVSDSVKEIFKRKPYYVIYEEERKKYGQTLQ